jgi:8-oxo-dGTP pyrophosphatase MutT (NUDIX family)
VILELESLPLRYPHRLKPTIPISGSKPASVIIPLFKDANGQDNVVLTKRSETLKNHPGQISFPGGVCGNEEELLETAEREWEEEVGEPRTTLDVIGSFGEFNTFTGFIIVPFIAYYSGKFIFKPNKEEVDKMIFLNLEVFNTGAFFEMENPRSPGKQVYYLELEDELLWGATAQILVRLLHEFGSFHRRGIRVLSNLDKPPFFSPNIEYKIQP